MGQKEKEMRYILRGIYRREKSEKAGKKEMEKDRKIDNDTRRKENKGKDHITVRVLEGKNN